MYRESYRSRRPKGWLTNRASPVVHRYWSAIRFRIRVIAEVLASAEPGDYVGLHAYLPPTEDLTASLQDLRAAIQDRYGIAVTWGTVLVSFTPQGSFTMEIAATDISSNSYPKPCLTFPFPIP